MAFLTTAQQNKLKALYPEVPKWDFERYTYGVTKLTLGDESKYKKISKSGRDMLNPSQLKQIKIGRKLSRVDLTEDVLNKIKNFKSSPGLGFSLEQDRRGDAERTPRIRIRLRNPKKGYTGSTSWTFDASPQGYRDAIKKHNDLKPSVGKVQTAEEISLAGSAHRKTYNILKETYAADLVKWLKTNALNEKYKVRGGVDQLFRDAIKEFSGDKYTKVPKELIGATGESKWLNNNLFVKEGRFQLPRNYELLENFNTASGGYRGQTGILKQFMAYQLLDKNKNFTNLMEDLTDFYTGKKKKADFNPKDLARATSFARANKIGGGSTLGKFLVKNGFNFDNKIYQWNKFVSTYQQLGEELKNPNLPKYRVDQIRAARSRITRNSDTVLKQLKGEFPNLFRSQSMILEHANPQAFAKTESFFPTNFRLKAQYVPSAFNALKNHNFDRGFVKLASRYNNETDSLLKDEIKTSIKNHVKKFNDLTKVRGVGYLDDLDITYGKDKIRVFDKAKLISDLTDQDTIKQVLKNTEHSNQYLRNFPESKVKLNPRSKTSYVVKDLQLDVPTFKEVSQKSSLQKFLQYDVIGLSKTNAGGVCAIKSIVPKNLAGGGRIGFAAGSNCAREMEIAVNKNPLKVTQEIAELPGNKTINTVKNAARGFLGALGKFAPTAGKYGAIAAVGALAQPLVKQFMNDDPSTYLTDPEQTEGMLLSTIEAQERKKPRSEILDWGTTAGTLGATAAAVPGSGALYKFRRGLSEAKIPKAGPVSESGLTAGDYLSKHAGKGYGKLRAGAGVGMKLLSGMFTPAGLMATEPLRIAQKRREGESWGDIGTDPTMWMGPAFAPSMTRIATAGMKKGSLLPKLLRLGISRGALAAMGPVGWAGLAASLGWTGVEQYQDYKKKRGFFARDEE